MKPGMTFTIEPMINQGVREAIIDPDQWTARTKDGKPSAQWEHTILITETGHEILTHHH
jgi:methionyl aminopeptidase